MAQLVKNLTAMSETWVWSLAWEDPQEKEMATNSSIPGWRIPWTEEPGRPQPMGSQRLWRWLSNFAAPKHNIYIIPGNRICRWYFNHLSTIGTWFFFLFFGYFQDLSSQTRDRTHAPCTGSSESQSLDHQGSPTTWFFFFLIYIYLFVCAGSD